MRIDKVYIEDYKNLKDFNIDLDEKEMKTVLLGQNATGKSNFMEALILIFKNLDLSTELKRVYPKFNYSITYNIKEYIINVKVETNGKTKKPEYIITIGREPIKSFKSFFSKEGKVLYQPKYVFTYYSGLSNKLKEHFWDHQNNFYSKIINDDFKETELDSLRKLFYVQLVHSYFVLLAYFTHEDEEKESIAFLNEVLNIQDIESILFVLKMPKWADSRIKDNPDDIFWTAKGLVRPFLEKLWELSVAPIYNDESIRTDFDDYDSQKRLYLFLKGKDKLQELAKTYTSNTSLFKALESTYISKLIAEVRIKVKKNNVDGSITFKELSEGEQQLLTVLGLLKFTKDDDSLILLDEPDTHLNPIWKWRYLEFLDKVVQRPKSTQIILNTHDPLVIGGLKKEEVRIFQTTTSGKLQVKQPEFDPRGLGVEGILTSELFGLPTTLDEHTKGILDARNNLLVKQQSQELTDNEQIQLRNIFSELENLGFSNTFRDPLYEKFIVAYKKRIKDETKLSYTKEDIEKQNKIAFEILDELSKEENK
jgi:predicted ATPase